jgi:uncharacterized protein (DUF608 family)
MYACNVEEKSGSKRAFNTRYEGDYTNKIAFPIGGLGTGMFCVEGTGAISNMSLRHRPDVFHEPTMFAALHLKNMENGTKILEGPVPDWKKFGMPHSALGGGGTWGLPRFKESSFQARFPFAEIELKDQDLPVEVTLTAWNPFIPTDADHSSLPVGGFEYRFTNTGKEELDAIFSYNTRNFMYVHGKGNSYIRSFKNGFVLCQTGHENEPHHEGEFAIFTDEPETVVNHNWFRGAWFDPLTICWNNICNGEMPTRKEREPGAPGGSLFVPVKIKPGETKTIRLYMAWYVPYSHLRIGGEPKSDADLPDHPAPAAKVAEMYAYDNTGAGNYRPWYSAKFNRVDDVAAYWLANYADLKDKTQRFTHSFYESSLPAEVLEAIAANLTILKSPTVFRQYDGRLWNWEGCGDTWGSCHGSCTHVWNYAQAIPHLFPDMERTLRETEFFVGQDKRGHQVFRNNLPIRPVVHDFHSAADGQLGGIMKAYREWRIYGKNEWLEMIYPAVRQSMDYCIHVWDPDSIGAIEEPHHNTYDIEFWGANGMINSFYSGALQAVVLMGKALGEDVSRYESLLAKSKEYMETKLFDGEYFIQNIRWKDLKAPDPTKAQSFHTQYTPEAIAILEKEGPKYQYGTGCLSDGVLGSWMSLVCGMPEIMDKDKIKSHLVAVHQHNLKKNLRNHANPQRPTFALGDDGGLLLCSWPKGGKLQLPFVYSNEVWTGIEYQVASHLMFEGEVEKGLEIVRTCRERYDGRTRNPFNEYECGAWYARAMACYGLLEGLTGIRYDAVDQTLYIDSRIGPDFTSFISTQTGFGNAGLKNGKPFLDVKYGTIDVKKWAVSDLCNKNAKKQTNMETWKKGTFGYDLQFLSEKEEKIIVLSGNEGEAQILVSPKYQAKVFTSTAEGLPGKSLGFVNYDVLNSDVTNEHMNGYGGENRFWLGPEGGKYSVYFEKGKEQVYDHWHTPKPIDIEPWNVVSANHQQVVFQKMMDVTNYQGNTLKLRVDRQITLIETPEIELDFGLNLSPTVRTVAYRTDNRITNLNDFEWTEETGAICIWILDMFMPSPEATTAIPFNPGHEAELGKVVTSDYFGEIPPDRLKTSDRIIYLKTDGKYRSKLGLNSKRTTAIAGNYDPLSGHLIITTYDADKNAAYLNQEWNPTKDPLTGDAMNAYNDGPLEDGSIMGPFLELESASPAAFLKPEASLSHKHAVYHFIGAEKDLNPVAEKLLGVSLREIKTAFK